VVNGECVVFGGIEGWCVDADCRKPTLGQKCGRIPVEYRISLKIRLVSPTAVPPGPQKEYFGCGYPFHVGVEMGHVDAPAARCTVQDACASEESGKIDRADTLTIGQHVSGGIYMGAHMGGKANCGQRISICGYGASPMDGDRFVAGVHRHTVMDGMAQIDEPVC